MSRERIRTLKPEFFQDEKISQLSLGARLLFIGIITGADDEGRIRANYGALRYRVFPHDMAITDRKVRGMLKEIAGSGLVVAWSEGPFDYMAIRHWARHQRPTRPTPSELPPPPDPVVVEENSIADSGTDQVRGGIPEAVRRALARREGAVPGAITDLECAYCSAPGTVEWTLLMSGRPSSWVKVSGLDIDHVLPVAEGGETILENLVFACPRCNRSKGARTESRTGNDTESRTNPSRVPFPSVPVPSSNGLGLTLQGTAEVDARDHIAELFDYWREKCGHGAAKLTAERRRKIAARLHEGYSPEQVREGIDGAARAPFVNEQGHRFDDIELICRNGVKLESFIGRTSGGRTKAERGAAGMAAINRLMGDAA